MHDPATYLRANIDLMTNKLFLEGPSVSGSDYADWDLSMISEFTFNLNLVTGKEFGSRPSSCAAFSSGLTEIILTTRIPEKIFRFRDLTLNINTYNAVTGSLNTDLVAIPLITPGLKFAQFKTININKVYFTNGYNWEDITVLSFLRFVIRFQNLIPDNTVSLIGCRVHTDSIAVTFGFQDVYRIVVQDFVYNSLDGLSEQSKNSG